MALVREEDKVQGPVYIISRALRGAEERYPQMEKLAFALVTTTRKLKPYFQAHTIIILIDKPLQKAMNSPETAGRITLWAVELSEFDIQYRPLTTVKGQVVADFIAKFTLMEDQGAEEIPMWSIHTNGSSNRHAGGVGVVLHTPKGDKIKCMIHLDFFTTNNEVNGSYECKNERKKRYLEEVKGRISNLQMKLVQIPREENQCADQLAKATSAKPMIVPDQVLSFVQLSSLIENTDMKEVSEERCWLTPIAAYLKNNELPDNKEAARKLKVKAARFILIKDVLYKRGFSRPYLRCLASKEADYIIREVHEGICGNHSESRSLVHKLVQAGYYWPTMQKDADAYVRACDKCQRFDNLIRQPTEELTLMMAPWPFV
ncbi:uncharacterized protein LOC142639961 [Castanea sativa]|uniref:uncharacterized protein LOC142639961 n=1 Tax=Castanea sativa TaxID=21020 RepID=UPI003F6521A9